MRSTTSGGSARSGNTGSASASMVVIGVCNKRCSKRMGSRPPGGEAGGTASAAAAAARRRRGCGGGSSSRPRDVPPPLKLCSVLRAYRCAQIAQRRCSVTAAAKRSAVGREGCQTVRQSFDRRWVKSPP